MSDECVTSLELEQMPAYQEAKRLSETIGPRDGESADDVMYEALVVATATRLQREGATLEFGCLYREVDYTHPEEICDVLVQRLIDRDGYATLPFAGMYEKIAPIVRAMPSEVQGFIYQHFERRYGGSA